jgi:uncharacterized protein DUF2637
MRSGSSDPTVAPRHTTTQRRLLMVLASFGVAGLTGVAFVLSYDDLRALALAGRAATRHAPAYPIMYDGLIVVTILSLLVARNARWWSRWTRWLLLLALLTGAAAAGIQRAVRGYDSLPDQALVAGVAATPHVVLVIAVWLWLAMFRQARSALARRAAAPRLGPVAKVAEELPAHTAYENADLVPGMREAPAPAMHREPEPPRPTEPVSPVSPVAFADTEPSVRILTDGPPGAHPAFPPRYSRPAHPPPLYPQPTFAETSTSGQAHTDSDHDTLEPEPHAPAPPNPPSEASSEPSSEPRPTVRAATTRPDIVMPDALDSAEDDVDDPVIERAEDPDAGDGEPATGGALPHRPEPPADDDAPSGTAAKDPDDSGSTPDDKADDEADYDLERWSVTTPHDARRWSEDAADDLSDDGYTPDVEGPPSSTLRSSPTPPTG